MSLSEPLVSLIVLQREGKAEQSRARERQREKERETETEREREREREAGSHKKTNFVSRKGTVKSLRSDPKIKIGCQPKLPKICLDVCLLASTVKHVQLITSRKSLWSRAIWKFGQEI